jgi:hypothetical protein
LHPECDRPVVRKRNLHVRTEHTGLDNRVALTCPHDQKIEQSPPLGGLRGGAEPRASALARIGRQRELGYEQEPALDVLQAQIHPIFRVGKDPIRQQPLQQALNLRFRVVLLNADQYDQPTADLPDDPIVDADLGAGDSLE